MALRDLNEIVVPPPQNPRNVMTDFLYKTIQLDPGFLTRTSQIQLLYGIWVNLAQLGIGLAFGFSAVQVPQLSSPGSDILITRVEASWIASVLTLFAPIGCLISGYMMDRFGRRLMVILCQGPMFIGWLYTSMAKTPKHIIIGRAITGIGCGMAMAPPRIYCTEISLPNMRGVIGAFPALAMSIGICVQAGLGQYCDWPVLCYICSVFTLACCFLYFWLPETPYFVLKTKNEEEARANLAIFRGSEYDLDKEMTQLQDFKADNDIRKLSMKEQIIALFTTSSCKPFSLIMAYIFISQASGISCILMWSIEMLMVANSSYDVHTGNFLLTITRLVVGFITSILLFRIGRKPLALISAIGVSFICFTIGFYLTYHDEPSLVPQICFMLYMAFASLGYYTLPFLMASELYPLKVRGILSGITISLACFLIFGSAKVYPFLMDHLGLAYMLVTFGGCSLMGAIFLYFFLPETKELTLQEIEEYYNEIRPTLVSQRRIVSMQLVIRSSTTSNKSKSSIDKTKSTRHPADLLGAGSTLIKLETKKRLFKLLERDEKAKADDSTKMSANEESTSMGANAEKKESLKYIGTVKNMKPVEIKEFQGNERSTSSKESIKNKNNITELTKSQSQVKLKPSKEYIKENGEIKQNEEESSKIKVLEGIKESERNIEAVKSKESIKIIKERVTSIEKSDSEEASKDENQPSTSKQNS